MERGGPSLRFPIAPEQRAELERLIVQRGLRQAP